MLRYLRGGSGKAAAGGGPDVEALLAELQKQVSEATVQAFAGSSELPNGGAQERRALLLRYLRAGELAEDGVPSFAALRSCNALAAAAASGAQEVPSARHLCIHCSCLCKSCTAVASPGTAPLAHFDHILHFSTNLEPAEKLDVASAAQRLERQAAWRRGWGDVTEVRVV